MDAENNGNPRFQILAGVAVVAGVLLWWGFFRSPQDPGAETVARAAVLPAVEGPKKRGSTPVPWAKIEPQKVDDGVDPLGSAPSAIEDETFVPEEAERDWYFESCDRCMAEKCSDEGGSSLDLCPREDQGCRAVLDCEIESGCIRSNTNAASCYCGTMTDLLRCGDPTDEVVPDGPCKDLIEKAMGTTDRKTIVYNFDRRDHAAGRAHLAAACLSQRCFDACIAKPR